MQINSGHASIGLALAAALAAGGCRNEAVMPTNNASIAANVASEPAPKAIIEPPAPLDRRQLLLAAIEARSAAASGTDDRQAQDPLANRRFSFRISLDCTPPAPPVAASAPPAEVPASAAPRRTVGAAPDLSLAVPLVAAIAGEGVEAAEGFWIARPWLLTPSCAGPERRETPEFGLVQYFTSEESRTARREGRAYEAAIPDEEAGAAPRPGRWELVLAGRLQKRGDGRVIECRPPGEGALPVCLIAVRFEDVAIEDRETKDVLARWGRG